MDSNDQRLSEIREASEENVEMTSMASQQHVDEWIQSPQASDSNDSTETDHNDPSEALSIAAQPSERLMTPRSILFSESNNFAPTDWDETSNPWEGVEIVWPEPLPLDSPSPFPPDETDRQFNPWAEVSQDSFQMDDRMTHEFVGRGEQISNLLAQNENELLAVKQIGSAMQSFMRSQEKEERKTDMQAPSEKELTDSENDTLLASELKSVLVTQDAVTVQPLESGVQSSQSQILGKKTRKSLFPEFSPEFFAELISPGTNFSGKIPSVVRISRQGPSNPGQVRQVSADPDQSRPILDDYARISQILIGQQVRPGPTNPAGPRRGPAEPARSAHLDEDPVWTEHEIL